MSAPDHDQRLDEVLKRLFDKVFNDLEQAGFSHEEIHSAFEKQMDRLDEESETIIAYQHEMRPKLRPHKVVGE